MLLARMLKLCKGLSIVLIVNVLTPIQAAKPPLPAKPLLEKDLVKDTVKMKEAVKYLDTSLEKFSNTLKIKSTKLNRTPFGVTPYSSKSDESRPAGKIATSLLYTSDLYELLKILRYDLRDPKVTLKTWKVLRDKVEKCLKNIESTIVTEEGLTKLLPIEPKTINLRIELTNLIKPYIKSLKKEVELMRAGADKIVAQYKPEGNV